MIRALIYINENGIMHRDIRLSSIIIDLRANGEIDKVKLNNFGRSCQIFVDGYHNQMMLTKESLAYMAPELLSKKCRYHANVDTWSLGVVLYELVC